MKPYISFKGRKLCADSSTSFINITSKADSIYISIVEDSVVGCIQVQLATLGTDNNILDLSIIACIGIWRFNSIDQLRLSIGIKLCPICTGSSFYIFMTAGTLPRAVILQIPQIWVMAVLLYNLGSTTATAVIGCIKAAIGTRCKNNCQDNAQTAQQSSINHKLSFLPQDNKKQQNNNNL